MLDISCMVCMFLERVKGCCFTIFATMQPSLVTKDQLFKVGSHILIIWALSVTLTLKMANQFYHMKICLIMMHQHTKFGNKMFGSSEDHSNPIFSQDTVAYDDVPQTKFGCKRISSSKDTAETVMVVVALFPLARISRECSTIHPPPAHFFLFLF